MRPVCVTCHVWMKCVKNGQVINEIDHEPHGYRHADLYQCPICGVRVVTGYGARMGAEQCTDDEIKASIPVS